MSSEPRRDGPLRVLYLSSLRARDTTSGSLVIHRHLERAASSFDVFHAHDDDALAEGERHLRVPLRPAYQRVQDTRWFRLVWSLNHGLGCSVDPRTLDTLCERVQPEVIFTVAEGPLMAATRRLARRRGLPLVTMFHDWASSWLPAPAWVKRLADRQLRALYRASQVNLCVSPALRDALGPHADSWVLPPIPAARPSPVPGGANPDSFHVAYAGVMHHLYRTEMEGLTLALHARGEADCLRVYAPTVPADGPFVTGPDALRSIQRGFLKGEAFDAALAAASAFLVVSPFGSEWRPISRFSFPSKIPEYCRFGKPLVLWGPADSAAVEWAVSNDAALVVTDPAPEAAAAAIRRLRGDPELQAKFAAAATRCAETLFDPVRLQRVFEAALWYSHEKTIRPPDAEGD